MRRIHRALTVPALLLAALAAVRPAPAAEAPRTTATGAVRDWLLLGAFPRDDAATRLTDAALADEPAAAPKAGDPAEGLVWKAHRAAGDAVNLADDKVGFAYHHNAVAYAFTYVLSPTSRDARLRLGSTGGIAAWLNGEPVWRHDTVRPLSPDEDDAPVRLQAGWNLLLLKLAHGTGPWSFTARVTDGDGRSIPGLQCVSQPAAAREPLPKPPPHGVAGLGCDLHPPAAGEDGVIRVRLTIRLRNLTPAAVTNASVTLNADPKTALQGVPWPETGPVPPWGRKTVRIDLAIPDLLILAGGATPGLEITSGGASRFTALDADFPVRVLQRLLAPARIGAWRVLNQDDKGAAEATFPGDASLPTLAPDAEVTPAAPALWLRARVTVPAPLAGAPLALAAGRAGLRTELFVNGASLGESKGLEAPFPLPAGPSEHVIALRVQPSGTRPLRLPVAEVALVEKTARFCARNLDACLTLYPDLREPVRAESLKALRALAAGGSTPFAGELARLNGMLQKRARGLKDFTVWYVGRSHLDLAWLWRREESVRLAQDAFNQALRLAEEFPRFTYAQGQAAVYAAVEQHAPDLFAKVRQAATARRWSVVGGMWVEPDLTLPAGESLVRQLLHGQRYLRRAFGREATVGWLPDAPGPSAQIPQLLRKAGLDACHVLRGTGSRRLFRWEGLDGSRVLVHAVPPSPPSPDFVRELREAERLAAAHLQPYGSDAPGGGPTRDDVRRIDALRAREIFPTADCGTPEEFFARAKGTTGNLPLLRGGLPDAAAGTWTSRGTIKQANRRGEGLLADAETAAALARDAGLPCDRAALRRAWRLLLFNQAHHILGGTAIRDVYADAEADHAALAAEAGNVLRTALDALSRRLPTAGKGTPVVVFNPLPWSRTDAAAVDVLTEGPLRTLAVFNDEGEEVPSQVTPRPAAPVRVRFLARDIPGAGFRVYHVRDAGKAKRTFPAVAVGGNGASIETDRWRLALDRSTGCFTLRDLKHGRDAVVAAADGGAAPRGGNRLVLLGDRGADSARSITYTGERWDADRDAKVEVLEAGPVRAVVRVTRTFKDERPDYTFGGLSTFRQELVIYRDLDRIEIRHDVDWNERFKILKLAFPVGVKPGPVAAEIPYGVVTRPADGADRPAGTWFDLSEKTYGVAVLNDGRAGFDAAGSRLRVHLLRSPFDVDPASDRGTHRFALALLPHAGDWRHAELPRRGREFNRPLRAWVARPHAGTLETGEPFIAVEPGNVVADAVKPAEDSDALVVRIAEMHGVKGTVARIRLRRDAVKAATTDLLERGGADIPVDGKVVEVPLGPFEIKTIRIGPGG